MAVTITAAAQTDIGCVRKSNQDTFGIDSTARLYIVCDGMGGAAGGEIASHLSVEAFLGSFVHALTTDLTSVSEPERSDLLLFQAAKAANAAVLAHADVHPALHGMGSTLVAAHIEARRLHLINIGDSRAYRIRDGRCTQLTVDHSYLQEQVRLGMMTQAMADASPMQSVITRAVGVAEGVEPDLTNADVLDGDRILLTSDGLTRHVSDADIARIVSEERRFTQNDLDACCRRLIDLAKRRGGSDNVTCVLLHISIS